MKHKINIIIEISVVLIAMLIIKSIADSFEINGAGSIAVWCAIFVATIFMRRRKSTWQNLGLDLPNGYRSWLRSIGLALLTVITVFLLMGLVLDPILTYFGLEKPSDVADRFQFFLGKPVLFITYLVTVVWIGAALGEELLMRGFLLNRLSDVFGKNKTGWIITMLVHALIFGLLHIYQGLAGIITTAFIALVLGSVYLIAKRKLFPVILAHLIINTISLTAFYLTDGVVN